MPIARIATSNANRPLFARLSRIVVMPKPIRPSGAGLANLVLPIIPQNYH
ncbi:hypothetical protein UUU_04730 [Klebsiella pneumoniae subsp. pneumoniae DSM 30104 = JCM 1662 = NBRC 14940]|nr:hypothetical protein UUU_04730 [Klebsiella pneumoniae subsp. pneumoniae DSM 30104 = JCM 1662 = NBRC 14940]